MTLCRGSLTLVLFLSPLARTAEESPRSRSMMCLVITVKTVILTVCRGGKMALSVQNHSPVIS